MINREDMLELTRRMTPARTSFTRIAGCYVDADGDFDGSFNINFLKLSPSEKTKNLAIAKTIPFAETNTKLKKYEIQPENQKAGSMWQLLMALRDCELKNDALMDTLYDIIMENIRITTPYAIYVFHDNYDIPAKATDKERLRRIRRDVSLPHLRHLSSWSANTNPDPQHPASSSPPLQTAR